MEEMGIHGLKGLRLLVSKMLGRPLGRELAYRPESEHRERTRQAGEVAVEDDSDIDLAPGKGIVDETDMRRPGKVDAVEDGAEGILGVLAFQVIDVAFQGAHIHFDNTGEESVDDEAAGPVEELGELWTAAHARDPARGRDRHCPNYSTPNEDPW